MVRVVDNKHTIESLIFNAHRFHTIQIKEAIRTTILRESKLHKPNYYKEILKKETCKENWKKLQENQIHTTKEIKNAKKPTVKRPRKKNNKITVGRWDRETLKKGNPERKVKESQILTQTNKSNQIW